MVKLIPRISVNPFNKKDFIMFNISERGQEFYQRTKDFIETEIEPIEAELLGPKGTGNW